ncbi:MAG: diguanylate cyclase [Steroidobacteraceae bacterium]
MIRVNNTTAPRARALRLPAFGVLLTVLLAFLVGANAARADCLESPYPDVRSLEALSVQDPKKALEAIRTALADAQRSTAKDKRHLAALYAVAAQSYSLLELDADARSAAATGLELAPEPTDLTHLILRIAHAENIYDSAGIDSAITAIEKARSTQPRGSRAAVCLQITLGRLQFRRGRADLALLTLTEAYRASLRLAAAAPRVEAASTLSPVMRVVGDFGQALALNQESIDWEQSHNATLSLSVARYLRGQILSEMRDYKAAIEETWKARKLSVQLADQQGIGFADLALCEDRLELGQPGVARVDCESALPVFTASQSADVIRKAQVLLARVDLAEGHPDTALASLNDVLNKGSADVQPRQLPGVYYVRAQANAALHRYSDAYRDLDEYLKRYVASVDAERAQQVAALRARFETDREIERNDSLQHQLELAGERAERQRSQLRWVVIATTASGIVIALLTYLLIANLRYRKQLVRLATRDSLTGLPNRGRMAAVATQALAAAHTTQQPLSVALIDLDRFKTLNDHCGHASGDRVLKEFAAIATAAIRPTDILGRWGGEEFLLVLPDTTLDTAMEMLNFIRQKVAQIKLEGWDIRVSISAGLATSGQGAFSLDEILARADVALYKAKNSGRDLVCYAEESFQSASTGVRRALRQR